MPEDVDGPAPLLFVLHGLGGDPASIARSTGLGDAAVDAGYVVVAPAGHERSWNAAACCGAASARGVDDVSLIASVVDDVAETVDVDRTRVVAAGFSKGGMLAHRLACERSDVVAAVAVVGGDLTSPCTSPGAADVLHVHGALQTGGRASWPGGAPRASSLP